MPTEKNLDIMLESELEFKPYSPAFDTFKKEPVTFLLVNALKYLTEDQRKQLHNALGERLYPTPASITDEAEKLYPYHPQNDEMYTDSMVTNIQRSAHITCAGMYQGEIERLKNDLATLEAENKALIEEIQNWKDELRDQAREHRNNR